MPRLRRSMARGRQLEYVHAMALLDGYDWFNVLPTDADREAMWEVAREEWLGDYIELACGTRPWAWWRFDATEPRRCVEGPGNYTYRTATVAERPKLLWFGRPSCSCQRDVDEPSVYETQLEYLQRLDLLEPSEKELLTALVARGEQYVEPEFNVRTWWNEKYPENPR